MNGLAPISIFDKDKSLMVKKSNSLIRSKYNLSLIEQRIILIGISFIQDKNNKNVYIPVTEYKNLLNIEHFNYQHLIDVLKKLRENSIVTVRINPKTGELEEGLITGWVDSVHYKDGIIQIRFNEDIWEHLIELKEKYAEYQLSSVLSLKSKYSIRMYEILKSYAYIGYYTANVDEIREMLLLENKYSRFNDLEKVIIEPSIREINENESLDIRISYTPIKTGRKFGAVKFVITKKEIEDSNSTYPPEFMMARGMSEIELFTSIKTMIMMKYKTVFLSSDREWQDHTLYSRHALESTFVALMSDDWKEHHITSHKAFFAEHLHRLTEKSAVS